MSTESATRSPNASALQPVSSPAAAPGPRGRASWSGLLRLSLVAVPVKAYPAVSTSDALHFHQLHADCGQRISYQKCCAQHGTVEAAAIERGYEYAPGQYVVIDPAELEALRPAREKALVLKQLVDAGQVDPVLFSGRTLYLLPDGLAAQRPYLVLAEALQERGRWGLGNVTLSANRQLVLVRPAGRLLATVGRTSVALPGRFRRVPLKPATRPPASVRVWHPPHSALAGTSHSPTRYRRARGDG